MSPTDPLTEENFFQVYAARMKALADVMEPRPPSDLWPLIHALERACWKRKWSEVKAARKALETRLGKRPHDPLFGDVQAATPLTEGKG